MMHCYAKKTLIGNYEPAEAGDYVVMDKSSYIELTAGIEKYKNSYENFKFRCESLEKENTNISIKMNELREEYKEVLGHREQLREDVKELDEYKYLNDNLIRIMKERNNASRDIKPKKQRTGYIIKSSGKYTSIQADGINENVATELWRTLIETPLSIDLTFEQAKRQINKDLKGNFIGIDKNNNLAYIKAYFGELRKDFKTNLWMVVVKSKEELKGIAEDMGYERENS